MNPLISLLAQAQRTALTADQMAEQIRKGWQSGATIDPKPVLIAVGVLAAVLGAVWFRKTNKLRRQRNRPIRIFSDIVADFGLTSPDRRLLTRIARQQQLPSPLTLILSPATFDHHVQRHCATLGISSQSRFTQRLQRIRQALFG